MSVADKMTQIAQNVPKVYAAGERAQEERIRGQLNEALAEEGFDPLGPDEELVCAVENASANGYQSGLNHATDELNGALSEYGVSPAIDPEAPDFADAVRRTYTAGYEKGKGEAEGVEASLDEILAIQNNHIGGGE